MTENEMMSSSNREILKELFRVEKWQKLKMYRLMVKYGMVWSSLNIIFYCHVMVKNETHLID